MTRRRPSIRDLNDVWVRAELARTSDGQRALDHWALAHTVTSAPIKRHHKRAAERIAARVLSSSN